MNVVQEGERQIIHRSFADIALLMIGSTNAKTKGTTLLMLIYTREAHSSAIR
jgi:hypothetical protein